MPQGGPWVGHKGNSPHCLQAENSDIRCLPCGSMEKHFINSSFPRIVWSLHLAYGFIQEDLKAVHMVPVPCWRPFPSPETTRNWSSWLGTVKEWLQKTGTTEELAHTNKYLMPLSQPSELYLTPANLRALSMLINLCGPFAQATVHTWWMHVQKWINRHNLLVLLRFALGIPGCFLVVFCYITYLIIFHEGWEDRRNLSE